MVKRGQAAVEFLMTYGWAVLVVLIALVALAYFGVLNPGKILPSTCVLFPGLACTDVLVTQNSVNLVVRNGFGSPITINQLDVYNTDGNLACFTPSSQFIGEGKDSIIPVGSCATGPLGSRFKGNLVIDYSTGTTLSHVSTGSITAPIETAGQAICDASGCTALPVFGIEENGEWESTLTLKAKDGIVASSEDDGIIEPDFIKIFFPTLNLGSGASISSVSFTMTHREILPGSCSITTTPRHKVWCVKGGSDFAVVPDVYTVSAVPQPPVPSFVDEIFDLSACITTPDEANNVVIKVVFDPETDVCGYQEIDYAQLGVVF